MSICYQNGYFSNIEWDLSVFFWKFTLLQKNQGSSDFSTSRILQISLITLALKPCSKHARKTLGMSRFPPKTGIQPSSTVSFFKGLSLVRVHIEMFLFEKPLIRKFARWSKKTTKCRKITRSLFFLQQRI